LNTHSAIQIERNSEDIEIEKCEITKNYRFAIYALNCNCRVKNNNLYSNLVGVYSEKSYCDVKKNWWGSSFGPTLLEREHNDRILLKFGRLSIFPWLVHKVENAGSSWEIDYDLFNIEINNSRYVEIELPEPDNDRDHVPDWWEEKWGYDPFSWDDHKNLDPDNDGLNNIEECFTDKWNVFLEYDWVESRNPDNASNKLPKEYIDRMIEAFVKQNITLHIDIGDLEGGEEIPYMTHYSYADIHDLYWNYFLHNDLNNPRKGIFHYCVVSDYGPGGGFVFMGWDHVDSFLVSAQMLHNNYPNYPREQVIVSGIFHELGHTFGLFVNDHGGIDNRVGSKIFTLQWWKYINYRSCMNYWHTYRVTDYSDGSKGKGDFDDWSNLDFKFFKNTHLEMPERYG
jgi:hypothetical protein